MSEGQTYLDFAWWLVISTGVAITATALAINILGSALRDANDPRRRS